MTNNLSRRWLVALVLFLGLTGCTAAGFSTSGAAPAQDSRALPQQTQAPEEGGPAAERQVAHTGSLTIRCLDVAKAAADLRALAESNAGFVSSERLSFSEGSRTGSSRIVLSVPSDSLNRVMDEAAKVGDLVTRGVTANDVTDQVVDVEARIRTLRESIDRIRALMKKAGSISDVAQVEGELTRRQSDLESLLAKQASLKGQVERAPITVTLIRPNQVDPANPFLTGLARAWDALQNSITVLLTVLGGLLPFALLGALIAWPIVRRFRRRRAPSVDAAKTTTAAAPGSDQDGAGD